MPERWRTLHRGFFELVALFMNGRWIEVVKASDSVAGLINVTDTNQVVLVEQHRPAMANLTDKMGTIIELVAGRRDHDGESTLSLFLREAKEEAGATIRRDQVFLLNNGQPVAVSPGMTTERVTLCYAEITSDQLAVGDQFGVAAEGERTTRRLMSADEFLAYQPQSLMVLTLQLYWRHLRDICRRSTMINSITTGARVG